jgi:hypothetical protein
MLVTPVPLRHPGAATVPAGRGPLGAVAGRHRPHDRASLTRADPAGWDGAVRAGVGWAGVGWADSAGWGGGVGTGGRGRRLLGWRDL